MKHSDKQSGKRSDNNWKRKDLDRAHLFCRYNFVEHSYHYMILSDRFPTYYNNQIEYDYICSYPGNDYQDAAFALEINLATSIL